MLVEAEAKWEWRSWSWGPMRSLFKPRYACPLAVALEKQALRKHDGN